MIRAVFSVCIIALICYVLVPLAGHICNTRAWKRALQRLRTEEGDALYCTSFTNGELIVKSFSPDQKEATITPQKTDFFILRKKDEIEKLDWNTVYLLQNGITLYFIPAKKKLKRNICLFYEEKNVTDLLERIGTLVVPEHVTNRVKLYSIATGAFLEFGLFLQLLKNPELHIASIAALVAIFGKALPYLPPGLFFTLGAHSVVRKGFGAKKNRQRKAAGLLLFTAGILLNIGVVFFVIRSISF